MSKRKADDNTYTKLPPSHEQVSCGECRKPMRRDQLKKHYKSFHSSCPVVRELGQSTLAGFFNKPKSTVASPSSAAQCLDESVDGDNDDLVSCGQCPARVKRDEIQNHFALNHPVSPNLLCSKDVAGPSPSPAKIAFFNPVNGYLTKKLLPLPMLVV